MIARKVKGKMKLEKKDKNLQISIILYIFTS